MTNRPKHSVIVGLTGTFGSGKSTVAGMFHRLGANTLDADRLAHEALKKGSPCYQKIIRLLGEGIRDRSSGALDRKMMAARVFQNPHLRKRLEAIVHPYVLKRMKQELSRSRKPVQVIEVPLLFEAGFDRFCDHTVLVQAPSGQIRRRLERKGFGPKEIRDRRNAQMPLSEKIRKADFVIRNSNSLKKTKQEVKKVWNIFKGEK